MVSAYIASVFETAQNINHRLLLNNNKKHFFVLKNIAILIKRGSVSTNRVLRKPDIIRKGVFSSFHYALLKQAIQK